MSYDRVAISSGHGKHVAGAVGILNEHQEAVRVVNAVAGALRLRGVEVETYEDTVSKNQQENLSRIVDWHNSRTRDVDVSVHFNSFSDPKANGTEVLYVSQAELADVMSEAIASAGTFTNRGPKKRTDLAFLNGTEMPAILLEVCFVSNPQDAELYQINFTDICEAIADVLGGEDEGDEIEPPAGEYLFEATGKCSHFGGPQDTGVSEDEGLAFLYEVLDAPHLFLPEGTPGTQGMGLARRLNGKAVHYCAARWDYSKTSKEMLAGDQMALVTNIVTGLSQTAWPSDWGPNENTGRVADLSPALMRDLGLETDDIVEIVYPYKGD